MHHTSVTPTRTIKSQTQTRPDRSIHPSCTRSNTYCPPTTPPVKSHPANGGSIEERKEKEGAGWPERTISYSSSTSQPPALASILSRSLLRQIDRARAQETPASTQQLVAMSSSSSSGASVAASFTPVSQQQMAAVENLPPPPPQQQQLAVQEEAPPGSESEQLCYVHCHFCDTVLVVRDRSLPPSNPTPLPSFLLSTLLLISSSVIKVDLVVCVQVSVPSSSLLKTVTVRCGHCSSLLTVNMRGLLFPTTTATPAASAVTTLTDISSPPPTTAGGSHHGQQFQYSSPAHSLNLAPGPGGNIHNPPRHSLSLLVLACSNGQPQILPGELFDRTF